MKYHIDTIPLWDAMDEDSECLLCLLEDKIEKSLVTFYLGDSVMQPDMREKSNAFGFCPTHYSMMNERNMKLSLSLTCYTRIETLRKDLDVKFDNILSRVKAGKMNIEDDLIEYIDSNRNSCLICDRLEESMIGYYHTFIHMWKKEPEFKKKLIASKGVCLHHYARLTERSKKDLMAKKRNVFSKDMAQLEKDNLERLSKEVKYFSDKFDHKNADKPWGTSRDSLPRAINKLSGKKQL